MAVLEKKRKRDRRHRRVRKKVAGNAGRPRLCVFKSLNHIYAQVINDEEGVTILAAGTLSPEFKGFKGTKTEKAREVGRLLGKKAKDHGVNMIVFDRGGYLYHGRVKALAEGARESGLQF